MQGCDLKRHKSVEHEGIIDIKNCYEGKMAHTNKPTHIQIASTNQNQKRDTENLEDMTELSVLNTGPVIDDDKPHPLDEKKSTHRCVDWKYLPYSIPQAKPQSRTT